MTSVYFLFLYDYWRQQRTLLPENDLVLLVIVLTVTLTLPLLGLFHLSWMPTLAVLALAGLFYAGRAAVIQRLRPAPWHGALHRTARLPLVWVMVSITGLFSWAWFW